MVDDYILDELYRRRQDCNRLEDDYLGPVFRVEPANQKMMWYDESAPFGPEDFKKMEKMMAKRASVKKRSAVKKPVKDLSGNWFCTVCGGLNSYRRKTCGRCSKKTAARYPKTKHDQDGHWTCQCGALNHEARPECWTCDTPRDFGGGVLRGGDFLKKTLDELRPQMEEKLWKSIDAQMQFISKFGLTPDEPPFVWKQANGKKIHPRDMDEQHLRNSISYTQRTLVAALGSATYLDRITWLARAFYEFLKEAKRRGIRV